jgi:hypothetical protein
MDMFVGYNFIVTTSVGQLYCGPLTLRPIPASSSSSSSSSLLSSTSTLLKTTKPKLGGSSYYQNVLDSPFQLPSVLEYASSNRPHVMSSSTSALGGGLGGDQANRYPDVVSEKSLRVLSAQVVEIRKSIAEIQACGLKLKER